MGKKNKRMAGELWRTYDAASRGSASFDKDDIKHLVKQGWSVNDIRKAAMAADHINDSADKHLRVLGTPDSKFTKFYKKNGYKGVTGEPLQWNGRDSNGRGLAIGGGPAGKNSRNPYQESWELPKDFIESREAAAFNRRMQAWRDANPPKQEPAKPKPAKPVTPVPAFDPADYAVFRSTAEAVEQPTIASSVAPPTEKEDRGNFLGGFESIINRRYGRPMNWAGDAWKT